MLWIPSDGLDWRKAACHGHLEPDLWFPDFTDEERTARAKAICDLCPLKQPCLERGASEPEGIWGGLTPTERRKLRRAG